MLGGFLALAISWLLGLEVGGAGKTPAVDMFGLAGENGVDPCSHVDLRVLVPLRIIPGHRAGRVGGLHRVRC